ncbi:MAG: aromatic ring-hydroxylating dioxygenase subunit alpha [Immundisolibacteraceae bacterium]|nr:aromatic ring-hydroxylating dioxygenase subunit alpha [Immundisolibacteraceae bacterium]
MKIEDLQNVIVDRTTEGEFTLDRNIYYDEDLFEVEMSTIFEGNWIFLAHEGHLPEANDFFTTWMGRKPVVLIRGEDNQIRGFINACTHRGATLCRTQRGNKKFLTCTYHGWSFDSQGKNRDVKDRETGGYTEQFDAGNQDLKQIAKIQNYHGFIFGSLNPDVPDLEEALGNAKPFMKMLGDQSPDGMEIIKGFSRYTTPSNWKFQLENGVDGYHVSTVHANYIGVVMKRMKEMEDDQVKSIARGNMSDMTSGTYDLGQGHTVLWGEVPGANDRPLAERRDELEQRLGKQSSDWMIGRARNLGIFPNVLLMDQTSTQIRVIRPISVGVTEITIYGIAPKGESAAARNRRIRQYEDFFNATGMATPDDLSEFAACQVGNYGLIDEHQSFDRGLGRVVMGGDETAENLGITPYSSGPDWADENLFQSFYRQWYKLVKAAYV